MTCKPDKTAIAGFLALLAVLALSLGWPLAAPLAAAAGDDAIADAVSALDRGDGVSAEVAGRRALAEGASRPQVAALIGEAEFMQGDMQAAREWLGPADFDPATQIRGLHALARLELSEENLPAASQIFDRILAQGPGTSLLWVDIGRMRYLGGEHRGALAAAREAVRLGPREPRALEFLAQLDRDAHGLGAALPLFRQALEVSPQDTGLMAQYAATLGDAGQHTEMLRVVRQMLDTDGSAVYGYYLEAILAARAGRDDMARQIWWKTEQSFDRTPAGLLVTGVLEYRSGNPAVAVENFDELRRLQPFNQTALLLYCRALVANGEAIVAIDLLEPHAKRPDASAYLLTLIGRAYEQLGQRANAAPYLDRAARLAVDMPAAIPAFLPRDTFGGVVNAEDPVMRLREMLGEGRNDDARALIGGLLAQFPGSADVQLIAGDVELLSGNPAGALERYRQVAQVRSDWPVIHRIAISLRSAGDAPGARGVLAAHLAVNPRDQPATAMLGRLQRDAGNPARATVLLRHAASFGSGPADPQLLADLAEMELLLGNKDQAAAQAQDAEDLQRANRRVAQVLARVTEMAGGNAQVVQALAAKARGQGTGAATAR